MAPRKTSKTSRKGAKKPAGGRSGKKEEKWTWTDILRTPILASLGAFTVAEEGVEKFVREIIERGEATEKEGKKFVDDFRKRAKNNRREMEKGIDERIQKTLRSFRLPTKADIDALEKKIDLLEKKIGNLSGRSKKR